MGLVQTPGGWIGTLLPTQLIERLTIAVVEQAVDDIGRNMREAAGGGRSIWIECHRSFPVYPAE